MVYLFAVLCVRTFRCDLHPDPHWPTRVSSHPPSSAPSYPVSFHPHRIPISPSDLTARIQPSWARRTLADVSAAEIDAIVAPFADKQEELIVTKDPYVCLFVCGARLLSCGFGLSSV